MVWVANPGPERKFLGHSICTIRGKIFLEHDRWHLRNGAKLSLSLTWTIFPGGWLHDMDANSQNSLSLSLSLCFSLRVKKEIVSFIIFWYGVHGDMLIMTWCEGEPCSTPVNSKNTAATSHSRRRTGFPDSPSSSSSSEMESLFTSSCRLW